MSGLPAQAEGVEAVRNSHDSYQFDEIIVTTSPLQRTRFESLTTVDILHGEELDISLAGTLGETLKKQPGLSSDFFGVGASKPVIRGLGSHRVQILHDGLAVLDASSSSPDHAIASDPMTSKTIEIIRGPATLMYGGTASGGAVNLIDERIPRELPDRFVTPSLGVLWGNNTGEFNIETSILLGYKNFAFHFDRNFRDAPDYEIPHGARTPDKRAADPLDPALAKEASKELPDSDSKTLTFGGGISYFFESGFVGASFSGIETEYSVPNGVIRLVEDAEGYERIHLDLDQQRYDVIGEFDRHDSFFNKVKFRFGMADYEHKEVENESQDLTSLVNVNGFEGRLDVQHAEIGNLSGAYGLQFRDKEFEIFGPEVYLPKNETQQYAVFWMESLKAGRVTIDAAVRYEHQSVRLMDLGDKEGFDNFSGSGAIGVRMTDDTILGISGFRTERSPSAEELYSDGEHAATRSFDVGNADLKQEIATGAELFWRGKADKAMFDASVFYTNYSDFIFRGPTGANIDGLPVFSYRQGDAEFYGWDAEAKFELYDDGEFIVNFDVAAEYVRGVEKNAADKDLPQIPPLSIVAGLQTVTDIIETRWEVEWYNSQSQIAAYETKTDGYALFNLTITLHPITDKANVAVHIIGRNLGDTTARNHISMLKDLVPMPGRDIRVMLTSRF